MARLKIAVIDPSGLFREGLVSLLAGVGLIPVLDAPSIRDLKPFSDAQAIPDILLIDSPRADSVVNTIDAVRAWSPTTKIVFLAQELDLDLLSKSFDASASGYLLKGISCEALVGALNLINAGEKVFPSALASRLAALASRFDHAAFNLTHLRDTGLSDREIEILRCLAIGHANKAIAAGLNIAESTVKIHVKRILRKTHASNRTQAAIWALEHGIFGESPDRETTAIECRSELTERARPWTLRAEEFRTTGNGTRDHVARETYRPLPENYQLLPQRAGNTNCPRETVGTVHDGKQ